MDGADNSLTSAKPVKRRRRFPPVSPDVIAEAIRRYEQGEILKAIALDRGVDYRRLAAATRPFQNDRRHRGVRKTPPIPAASAAHQASGAMTRARRAPLSPDIASVVVERWQKGESLQAIADSLGESVKRLTAATAAARKCLAEQPRGGLSAGQLKTAADLWMQGETLATIADTLGVGYDRAAKATKHLRTQSRRRQPVLKPEMLELVMARWQQGETLTAIARDLGVPFDWLHHRTKAARRGKRRPRHKQDA